MADSDYQAGYEAAYAEVYAAIQSDKHPRECGHCRACGLMRAVIEDAMFTLGLKLTEEEFSTLAGILARVNARE